MSEKFLIYGATGGIGSAVARLLRNRGYELHLAAKNADSLAALALELDADYTVGDVEDPGFFVRTADEAGELLSGLVYAVGTLKLSAFQRLTDEDFLADYRINALGAAKAVQASLASLKRCERSSSIVFYSSIAALQGFSLHASLGMAKGAVQGLTLSLAAELAPGIRVNAIAPSLTRTKLAGRILANEQTAKAIAEMHPLRRLGEPEDIAALTVFLLSRDAGWITGQVIGVDGGRGSLRLKG